jgi:hypothetical protein
VNKEIRNIRETGLIGVLQFFDPTIMLPLCGCKLNGLNYMITKLFCLYLSSHMLNCKLAGCTAKPEEN